jgi:hypothetical protein
MTAPADGSGVPREEQHSGRLPWRRLFSNYTFRIRTDDFSVQVSCDQDRRFWFRLEVATEEDRVTDFCLGAFDPDLGGDLLEVCYKMHARAPGNRIVFRDVFASRAADAATIENARASLAEHAKHLLAGHGRRLFGANIELQPGNKIDIIIYS